MFEERNRIRSQRGIATFTVAPTRHSHKTSSSSSRAPSSSEVILGCEAPSASTSSSSSHSASRRKSSRGNTPSISVPGPGLPGQGKSKHWGNDQFSGDDFHEEDKLFDPSRDAYPHPKLLPDLVDLFFLYAGSVFSFFNPVEIPRRAREGSLSPLIANCLAAYSARFASILSLCASSSL